MKALITFFAWVFVCINTFSVDAAPSMEVPDCNAVFEITENGVYYDRNSDFYYELNWNTQKKWENDWSNVRVRNMISADDFCKSQYALWRMYTVDLGEKYKAWSMIVADINFFFDDFGGSYYLGNVQLQNFVARDDTEIAYYKDQFRQRLDGNILEENIPAVLEKIYTLFMKYTQEDIIYNASSQQMMSQLRALQELLEEYIDEV